MLTTIQPKLPMRDKGATMEFYINKLGFKLYGSADYPDYLMLEKDSIEIHFFLHKKLDPKENYGQVYVRTDSIDELYSQVTASGIKAMPPANKHWRQREFSLLDPDNNLLTFGQHL